MKLSRAMAAMPVILGLQCWLYAQKSEQKSLPQSSTLTAGQLVREMVANELAGHDKSPWIYRMERQEKGVRRQFHVIDTDQGSLTLLICADGLPISDEQRRADSDRLQKLLSSKEAMAKKAVSDRNDAAKVDKVLKLLPDGLLFEYDGGDDQVIRLKFKPNPDFKPPSMEARVFQAMEGTLTVNRHQNRMMRIEGRLVSDVSFGWGILGNLKAGGTFRLEQSELASGYWALTSLDIQMQGKALFFRSINVQERLRLSNFQPAPAKLTLDQGLSVLKGLSFSCAGS